MNQVSTELKDLQMAVRNEKLAEFIPISNSYYLRQHSAYSTHQMAF